MSEQARRTEVYTKALKQAEAELAEVEHRRLVLLMVIDSFRYGLAVEDDVCLVVVPPQMMTMLQERL